jgi:hypothetical protein
MDTKDHLTVKDMAKELGVSETMVRGRASQRKIGTLFGRMRLFTPSDIALMQPRKPGNFRKKAD